MSSKLRIGGAALLGIVIILGAFYVQKMKRAEAITEGTIVTAAPPRQYIDTTDANGDGIEDWKNSVATNGFDTIATPTSSLALNTNEPYTAPTTFTGKFAQAFFTDYMEGKVNGADLKNKDQIIGNAVKAIEENTRSRIYTQKDIVVVADSLENLREYGNRVGEIIAQNNIVTDVNVAPEILKRALDTQDAGILLELKTTVAVYDKIIQDLLIIPTPTSLARSHVELVSATEAVRTDIGAMQKAFIDPLLTLARIKRYQDDTLGAFGVLKNISSILITKDISYTNDEPGSFFYNIGI